MDSVLVKDLKNFDYYVKKIPLYLQNDEKFLSHFKIWYEFLIGEEEKENDGLIGTGDTLLDLFNIYDENYLDKINKYGEDFLNKLANLFNIRRSFSVKYSDGQKEHLDSITLNNEELLLFIKARIIRNYSDGSYGQMRRFYEKNNLLIFLKWDSPAAARVYLLKIPGSSEEYSENIQKLFLAGLLNIESMGIIYTYSIQDFDKMLIWDKKISEETTGYKGWDNGEWVI